MKSKICFFALFLLVCSCEKKQEEEETLRYVVVEDVTSTIEVPSQYFSGFSKAEKEIEISFRVSGQIETLPIKVGDRIQKGQILAKLDDHDYQLEYKEAESKLQEALAEKRRASSHYKRIKILYESDSASRNELDTARADYESSVANVEKAMATQDLAKKQLSYTTIYADKNYCEVSEKRAEIFENVDIGQTVAVLSCGRKYEVEIAVPETSIAEISVGEQMDIVFNALPDATFSGKVTEVGVVSDGGTAYPVTIALDQYSPQLRAGMAAKAIIYGKEVQEPALVVPFEAVGEDKQGHYVYLFKPDANEEGIAVRQSVEVGDIIPGGFQIRSGLKEGDLIIVKGLRFIRDGKRVKRLEEKN